jgi:hypothetical protein
MPPLPVIGVQSGLTSESPIKPQEVQTVREHSERTTTSSGSQSTFSFALWLHHIEAQWTSRSRQPWPRIWPMVTGGKVLEVLAIGPACHRMRAAFKGGFMWSVGTFVQSMTAAG